MSSLRPFLLRLWCSPVVWSWSFSGLNLAGGILLLPLLLHLPTADLECYWALMSLTALVPLLDLGLLTSVDRGIAYAMGGAKELQAQGQAPGASAGGPSFPLLWKLMITTRTLYRYFAVGVFFIIGIWGAYAISLRAQETSRPEATWLALGLTVLGAVFEMYAGWWNVYLRGLNRVLLCARILTLTYAVRFLVSAGLLIAGAGLLSVPIASLLSSLIQRELSRHHSMKFLHTQPTPPAPSREEIWALFRTLWPNSWRMGVYYLSGYLTVNTFILLKLLDTATNAQYALSIKIITILQGMALVWVQVKWPLVGQLMAQQDFAGLRKIFRTRLRLQLLTFALGAVVLVPLAPSLVHWVRPDKDLLPLLWLALLAANALLDSHNSSWTTLICVGNRLPFLWPTVATNFVALFVALALVSFTDLGAGAYVLAPLAAGVVFNYWRWPLAGARLLQTRWRTLLFSSAS